MKSVRSQSVAALAALGFALLASPVASYGGDGAPLFKSKCAMCHGPEGKGDSAMGKKLNLKDLGSAEVQKASDAEITDIITKGKGKMPAIKGLTADQVKDVVAFVRTLKK